MDRFHCGGFLELTIHDYIEQTQHGSRARILLRHNLNHTRYCFISLTDSAKALIHARKGASPDEVCSEPLPRCLMLNPRS